MNLFEVSQGGVGNLREPPMPAFKTSVAHRARLVRTFGTLNGRRVQDASRPRKGPRPPDPLGHHLLLTSFA